MKTIKEAVASVRSFEEKRKSEGYSQDTDAVLQRVPLMEYDGKGGLGFDIKAGVHSDRVKGWVSNGTWELSLKDRRTVYVGDTPEEAIASALSNVCRLGRNGSIDPKNPTEPGVPPVQHCMNILQEHLAWTLERRQDVISHDTTTGKDSSQALDSYGNKIAALGTAIAALGRVKDQ